MAAETFQATLSLRATDAYGQGYTPAAIVSLLTGQTKWNLKEFSVPISTTITLWDPTNVTGDFSAFQQVYFWISDVGVATPNLSVTPLDIEPLVHGDTTTSQSFSARIAAGGFWMLASNVGFYTPTFQNDIWTGSTQGVINRLRAKNLSATVAVKLTMLMVDNTAP